jgi:nitrite reductase (NADH) small subunit
VVAAKPTAQIPATAVRVGVVDDFSEGQFRILEIKDKEVGVYRTRDGRWFAVRNFCPHRGAPICRGTVSGTMLPGQAGEYTYGMEEEVLRCPWHAMEFSLVNGQSVFGASKFNIAAYQVIVHENQVWVDTRRVRPNTQGADTA